VSAALRTEEVSALYAKYGFFLLRRCRTILRDAALADDALQEAFVKVMRGGAAIREADEPLRWLYRVVDRACFDALRKRRRSVESPSDDEGETAHPSVAIEARDAVLRLVGTLDEDEMRIAIHLVVDGMSQGEIAEEVGVSRVTVNKKVQAIRARAEVWLGRAEPRVGEARRSP
jgi:RNA polymerase sigma-70 factor (ECF subfamily)